MCGAAALVASLVAARPANASSWEDAGWGTLTILSNAVYMPAKLAYATLGGVTGGLAYALTVGDFQTAETIWVTSMGGTYVLTPSMLQGQESIAFSGTPGTSTTTTSDTGRTPGLDEQDLSAAVPR